MHILKRLLLWNSVTIPLGMFVAVLAEFFAGEGGPYLPRGLLVIQQSLLGGSIGMAGGTIAAITNNLASGILKKFGGSECVTGLVIFTGMLVAGLWLFGA